MCNVCVCIVQMGYESLNTRSAESILQLFCFKPYSNVKFSNKMLRLLHLSENKQTNIINNKTPKLSVYSHYKITYKITQIIV